MAVSRAHSLATTAQPGRASGGTDHWVERAEALLGPLLHAAALGGRGMASVLRWVQRRDVQEAIELAGSGNGHEIAADSIQGILETEDRERSGIFSTAANILSAYRLPAALQSASDPNFDPEAFVRSSDTVYVCFPTTEQEHLAPLVVAFLETVRRATYARGPDLAAGVVRLGRSRQHRAAAQLACARVRRRWPGTGDPRLPAGPLPGKGEVGRRCRWFPHAVWDQAVPTGCRRPEDAPARVHLGR